jgi:hypothetical protein
MRCTVALVVRFVVCVVDWGRHCGIAALRHCGIGRSNFFAAHRTWYEVRAIKYCYLILWFYVRVIYGATSLTKTDVSE